MIMVSDVEPGILVHTDFLMSEDRDYTRLYSTYYMCLH